MSAEILVNVRPNLTRVAFVEEGLLMDFKEERAASPTLVGGIFRGKVLRVLPGMQAAFVDIGLDRSAFLYVGDVRQDVDHLPSFLLEEDEENSEGSSGDENQESAVANTPIQDLLHAGQTIMVQVAKDPLGTKGARITTHISFAGRNLVYMPTVNHLGVSRKIESEQERERLLKIVQDLRPEGGVIIRTACEGSPQEHIQADLDYLQRLWKGVEKAYNKRKTPGMIHSELDVELRALRDLLRDGIQRVRVDDVKAHKKIVNFIGQFMPKYKDSVELYEGKSALFDLYDIDLEISRALERKVWLKSGGYIVIDEAEALVVIDVNTGRYVGKKDLEDTILKINLEAVKEIVHQLRIRNCGGIIIIDFIDMEKPVHREKVMTQLEQELAKDTVRTTMTPMSEFGLVEMTRKRTRPSLVSSLCEPCPYCDGTSYVKKVSTVAQEIFMALEREPAKSSNSAGDAKGLVVRCRGDVADWIYSEEQETLEFIEKRLGLAVVFRVEQDFHVEQFEVGDQLQAENL
ncbi:MAG: Rne/Rng family ribonuclease [Bdellovibrionales bacterium]|nr:Rne/Rng family ribonuclease [Bdellovibrionales bacterium]